MSRTKKRKRRVSRLSAGNVKRDGNVLMFTGYRNGCEHVIKIELFSIWLAERIHDECVGYVKEEAGKRRDSWMSADRALTRMGGQS